MFANGDGEGKGTHIKLSIYAYLMKGDYDNNLQLPFEGDVVIELLNWREDNHHYRGDTISFKKPNDSEGSITSHVVDDELLTTKFQGLDFISHSLKLTSTLYLHNYFLFPPFLTTLPPTLWRHDNIALAVTPPINSV